MWHFLSPGDKKSDEQSRSSGHTRRPASFFGVPADTTPILFILGGHDQRRSHAIFRVAAIFTVWACSRSLGQNNCWVLENWQGISRRHSKLAQTWQKSKMRDRVCDQQSALHRLVCHITTERLIMTARPSIGIWLCHLRLWCLVLDNAILPIRDSTLVSGCGSLSVLCGTLGTLKVFLQKYLKLQN